MERNRHVDEGTLHAWLDGALGAEEAARVEAHIAACAACGAKAAEARGLIAAASRILTALDDVPAGVRPSFRRPLEQRRRPFTGWPIRIAAAIAFVAVGSFAVVDRLGVVHPPERREAARPTLATAPPLPAAQPPAPQAVAPQAPSAAPPAAARKRAALPPKTLAKQSVPVPKEAAPAPAAAAAAGIPGGVVPGASAFSARRMAPARAAAVESAVVQSLIHTDRPVALTGHVVSAKTGAPVAAAQVALSNPRVSTATDSTGAYALVVPPRQAAGQQATLAVQRIGYQPKTDSVVVSADAAPHDVQLAPAPYVDEVVVADTGPPRPRCYRITTPGLPARIDLADTVHITSPDSVAFPHTSYSYTGRDSIELELHDTSGVEHDVLARVVPSGLRGQVTIADTALRPFAATRCP